MPLVACSNPRRRLTLALVGRFPVPCGTWNTRQVGSAAGFARSYGGARWASNRVSLPMQPQDMAALSEPQPVVHHHPSRPTPSV